MCTGSATLNGTAYDDLGDNDYKTIDWKTITTPCFIPSTYNLMTTSTLCPDGI